MKTKVVITSGHFNPLHSGHLALIDHCWQIAGCEFIDCKNNDTSRVCIIVNSDEQCIRKNDYSFLSEKERIQIMGHFGRGYICIDHDETVCMTLESIVRQWRLSDWCTKLGHEPDFFFAKGGDVSPENMNKKELEACQRLGVEVLYGVGSDVKSESSSAILTKYANYIRQSDQEKKLEYMKNIGILGSSGEYDGF